MDRIKFMEEIIIFRRNDSMKLFIRALFSLMLPITIVIIVPVLVILGFHNHLLPFNSALMGLCWQ